MVQVCVTDEYSKSQINLYSYSCCIGSNDSDEELLPADNLLAVLQHLDKIKVAKNHL